MNIDPVRRWSATGTSQWERLAATTTACCSRYVIPEAITA
jgi:hypothetical protein